MAKRPRVPAALHAELIEYSSLLRALRTSDTLDLTLHLTQPPPSFISQASLAGDVSVAGDEDDASYIDDDYDDDDGDGDGDGDGYDDGDNDDSNDDDADEEEALNELPPTDPVSQDSFSDAASPSQSNLDQPAKKRKAKQRDTWTRWPLLAGDVHVPEWNLSDEVKDITERVLAVSSPNKPVVVPEPSVEETVPASLDPPTPIAEQDDHSIPDVVLQALTADSAAFLARILALVTAHVPAAEKSMQNRITPISWETVVNVACANGVVSPRVAEVVRERMSGIFAPAQPNTIHRTQHLLTMRQGTSQMLSKHDDNILEVPDYTLDARKKPIKRKREPSKKKGPAAEDEAGPSTSAPKRQRLEDG